MIFVEVLSLRQRYHALITGISHLHSRASNHLSVTGKSANVIHHDLFLLCNWCSIWRKAQMFAGAPFVVVLIIFCFIIALRLWIKNQLSRRSNKKCPLQLRQMKRPRKLQQLFVVASNPRNGIQIDIRVYAVICIKIKNCKCSNLRDEAFKLQFYAKLC